MPYLGQTPRIEFEKYVAALQPLGVVRHRKDRQAGIGKYVEDGSFAFVVQSAGHFVEQIQAFSQQQPPGQSDALLFAAGNSVAAPA